MPDVNGVWALLDVLLAYFSETSTLLVTLGAGAFILLTLVSLFSRR